MLKSSVIGLILLSLCSCSQQNNPNSAPTALDPVKSACGAEMVPIPAGQFVMGSEDGSIDNKPPHPVKIASFLMDRYEVTQEVYEKVMGTNTSRRKNPKIPVEHVTWTAAAKFFNARSLQ